jgi:adenylate cyclase
MALEIEHKFLLVNDDWRSEVKKSVYYKQGYLSSSPLSSVRVRISENQAWLNIKSATIGSFRQEFEYEIPLADANSILDELCLKPLIEKTRHFIEHAPHLWEIDEFTGDNAGLIVAEIELTDIGEAFARPDWLGKEVTDDIRYYNNCLAKNPYKNWSNLPADEIT